MSSTNQPITHQKTRSRAMWILMGVLFGVWCLVTGILAALPRDSIRRIETAVIRNEKFREMFSRELLNWRPPYFAEMGHVVFYIPFGVAAVIGGRLWGGRAFWIMLAASGVWAAVAESTQFFVDDRTPRLLDLMASCLGIAIGAGIATIVAAGSSRLFTRKGTH